MPDDVNVGDVLYPTYDAGISGLSPGVQIVNKLTGADLLARTTTGVSEHPASGGSYDYTPGWTVPDGLVAFKVAWSNSAGTIVYTEDYRVKGATASATLTTVPWPDGTVVSAYREQAFSPSAPAPQEPAVATATVANATLTFTGLPKGRYVASAVVSGSRVSVAFWVD